MLYAWFNHQIRARVKWIPINEQKRKLCHLQIQIRRHLMGRKFPRRNRNYLPSLWVRRKTVRTHTTIDSTKKVSRRFVGVCVTRNGRNTVKVWITYWELSSTETSVNQSFCANTNTTRTSVVNVVFANTSSHWIDMLYLPVGTAPAWTRIWLREFQSRSSCCWCSSRSQFRLYDFVCGN